jgi:phosphoribosyl-AMP cyclohydrolase
VGARGRRARRPGHLSVSDEDILAAITFNADGLVPAIAQQHDTGEVLMLAWMNREAVAETLATQRVCYFSRSRNKLWRKGETSGQVQHLKELRVDCDGDTLLPHGPAVLLLPCSARQFPDRDCRATGFAREPIRRPQP